MNSAPPQQQVGVWGVWSLWGSCSVSCGGNGLKQRTRTCSIPNRCQGQGSEQVACTEAPCPVPQSNTNSWTGWSDWNQCSARQHLVLLTNLILIVF